MLAARLRPAAAQLLSPRGPLIIVLVILLAYGLAAPPSQTFGSYGLEDLKDILAFGFAFLGLAFRWMAVGDSSEGAETSRRVANLFILFGIFLMHGNVYVAVLGPVACAAIYLFALREGAPSKKPEALRDGRRKHATLRQSLADEWLPMTATLLALLLTEGYENIHGNLEAEVQHTLLALGIAGLLISAATLAGARLVRPDAGVPAIDRRAPAGMRGRPFNLHLSRQTADAFLIPWARLFLLLAAASLQLRRPYHQVMIMGGRAGKRGTETRWPAIASVIEGCGARSVLDFGCAEGWFLRRAVEELNCFGLGVDSYESRVMLGEAARLHAGEERMAIMKGKLTAEEVRDLPLFDVVICLSVLHWVIRAEGLAAAEEYVRALAGRARKALIFEVGAAETFAKRFAEQLPPHASGEDFVRRLLAAAGLTNVRVIARSQDINNAETRLLFVGEPHSSQ